MKKGKGKNSQRGKQQTAWSLTVVQPLVSSRKTFIRTEKRELLDDLQKERRGRGQKKKERKEKRKGARTRTLSSRPDSPTWGSTQAKQAPNPSDLKTGKKRGGLKSRKKKKQIDKNKGKGDERRCSDETEIEGGRIFESRAFPREGRWGPLREKDQEKKLKGKGKSRGRGIGVLELAFFGRRLDAF